MRFATISAIVTVLAVRALSVTAIKIPCSDITALWDEMVKAVLPTAEPSVMSAVLGRGIIGHCVVVP